MVNQLGAEGEGLAVAFLEERGWEIWERNWRCPYGEIDIVAQDPDGALVFVEVKTRSGVGFGDPLEAITTEKVCRLRRLAAQWLSEHDTSRDEVRVDAIGVLRRRGWRTEISYVRGAA